MSHSIFVRVQADDGPRWAVVADGRAVALAGDPFAGWERGADLGPLDGLPLLAPAAPSKIVCIGRNYAAHAAEHAAEVPAEPLLFLKPPSSVIGPGAPIRLPPQSQQVEHEAELALVIGRRCRNVTAADAWGYVGGVTCGNDVTARDLQRRDGQWTRAKGFDTFCPLGPQLVAGVSAADVADVAVYCRVNGVARQSGRSAEMVFDPAQLVAHIAGIMTLEPGDVIMTGTPAGVGPLAAGDLVEVEVEGIGVLRNPVV